MLPIVVRGHIFASITGPVTTWKVTLEFAHKVAHLSVLEQLPVIIGLNVTLGAPPLSVGMFAGHMEVYLSPGKDETKVNVINKRTIVSCTIVNLPRHVRLITLVVQWTKHRQLMMLFNQMLVLLFVVW